MKRIVISSMLFLMAILTLQSQTIVADWKIKQMGLDVYDMQSVNTLVGFLIVQKGDVIFNVTDVDSKETILAVSIDGLYFDQTATENSSYNEMRSGFATIDDMQRKGMLSLSIAKARGKNDIIHFKFANGNEICLTGSLIDAEKGHNIFKLCAAIDMLKEKGLTTAPLEHIMKYKSNK